MTPTVEQAALAAATYAAAQFRGLDSWMSYEDQLAKEWLKDKAFRCAIEYTIAKVADRMRYSRQMQEIAKQYGGGAKGAARVVGMIVGEWTSGHTTLDRELESFG